MAETLVSLGPDTLKVHGEAAVTALEPLTVRTLPIAWAYAASLRLRAVEHVDVLDVRVRVRGGAVGIGIGSPDLAAILDEAFVQPSDDVQIVSLLPPADGMGRLLIRTGDSRASATVEIHEVRGRPFSAFEASAQPPAPLLAPIVNWNRFYGTPGDSVREKRRVREYLALEEPVTMRWLEDLQIVIRPNDQLSRALFVSGAYEPNTMLALERLLPAGGVFFDVGAHVGVFSLVASRRVGAAGHVYSFEPSPRERSGLIRHLEMNRCTNVTVVPAAVGDAPGAASLMVASAEASGLNTVGSEFAYHGVPSERVIRVPMTTLDQVVEERGIHAVHVVKLDVEGAEYRCLRGAAGTLERHRPALIIELFSRSLIANGSTIDDLGTLLADASYRLFGIDDTAALRPIGGLADADEQNIVAIPAERPVS